MTHTAAVLYKYADAIITGHKQQTTDRYTKKLNNNIGNRCCVSHCLLQLLFVINKRPSTKVQANQIDMDMRRLESDSSTVA